MDLIPTQEEVVALLFQTGALRRGHFECIDGIHTDLRLETAVALRHYQHQKLLTVALSRLVRHDPSTAAAMPELSIVAASVSGVPVAYGLAEALHPKQTYWVERDEASGAPGFRQFLNPRRGEKTLLVDDVLCSGRSLAEAAELLQSYGVEVLGVATLFRVPEATAISFGGIPVHTLATLPASRYFPAAECEMCRCGVPLERRFSETREAVLAAAFS